MRLIAKSFALLSLLVLTFNIYATNDSPSFIDLQDDLYQLDTDGEGLVLGRVIESNQWKPVHGSKRFGWAKRVHWFQVKVPPFYNGNTGRILEIGNNLLDQIDVYFIVNGKLTTHYTSGTKLAYSTRAIKHRKLLFPIPNIEKTEQVNVYIRTYTKVATHFLLRAWSKDYFDRIDKVESLYTAFFIGGLFILGLYHLLIQIKLKKVYILAYAIFLLCVGFANLLNWGYGLEYLWPKADVPTKPFIFLSYLVSHISFCLFFMYFTGIYKSYLKLRCFYIAIILVALFGIVLLPFVELVTLLPMILLITLILYPSNIGISLYLWVKGDRGGMYYFLATIPIVIALVTAALAQFNVISRTIYFPYFGSFAVMITVILLAIAVAFRVNEKQRKSRQKIEELNTGLELKVAERTQELKNSLEQLESTKNQLVEAERVAALTGLVCGVAHEVNTPLGVSITATSSLRSSAESIHGDYADGSLNRSTMESFFTNTRESLDLIENSLSRASNLVQSFKGIAVNTEDTRVSTFSLREHLEYIISVFESSLNKTPPKVHLECSEACVIKSSQNLLMQLFLQLLDNSSHHAFPDGQPGNIFIVVNLINGDKVNISYRDDGKGLDEEDIPTIFNPFNTSSRSTGKVGLGTTVMYNIVTQGLGGSISCKSPSGEGLTYNIEFPVM